MIAKIIPIQRLPKQLSIFDYQIPEELKDSLAVGQLVTVPFRTSQSFGIVLSLEEKPSESFKKGLKTLTSIVQQEPILSKRHLHVARILAEWYGVSVATVVKLIMPPLQKRKLKQASWSAFPQWKKKEEGEQLFHQYTNENQHSAYLQKIIQTVQEHEQILIVVPEVQLLAKVRALLPNQTVALWHSGMSPKEQFATWMGIRNGHVQVVLGTRSAIFLPFYNLKSIILDYEHNDQHKHWDQTPRFSTHDISDLLGVVFGTPVHRISCSPSVEFFHSYSSVTVHQNKTPILVDMRSERAGHNYSVFSQTVSNALLNETGDIFLFLNRRGYATSLGCLECGFKYTCPSCELPFIYHEHDNKLKCHYCKTVGTFSLICPDCSSTMVKLRGAGTELVDKTVRGLLGPHHIHEILRIDGEEEIVVFPEMSDEKPRVIVGTEKALPYVRWDNTRLVVFINLDGQLSFPEFTIEEHVWHLIQEVNYNRSDMSTFYIQTMIPEHPLFTFLSSPEQFYERQLETRKKWHYPPSSFLVRYMYAHPNQFQAQKEADKAKIFLQKSLTKAGKSVILEGPFEMHPKFYRGKYWYAILAKLPVESWKNDLIWLNRHFPHTWRVDPHPLSLLSP